MATPVLPIAIHFAPTPMFKKSLLYLADWAKILKLAEASKSSRYVNLIAFISTKEEKGCKLTSFNFKSTFFFNTNNLLLLELLHKKQ